MYTGKWSVETENETGLDRMVQMMAEFMYWLLACKNLAVELPDAEYGDL